LPARTVPPGMVFEERRFASEHRIPISYATELAYALPGSAAVR
jgi:hypothetical protein